MDERVEKYIKEKEAEVKEKYEKEKEKKLVALGLVEKEYSPDGEYSNEFPYHDLISQKYYRKVPIKITDEEYQEILKCSTGTSEQEEETTTGNTVSIILKVIAWVIFIGGFVLGIILGYSFGSGVAFYYGYGSEFSALPALICWASAFISGISFLGFAEIIKLLDEIKRK